MTTGGAQSRRSPNDIAQDIIDAAPQVEQLVEELYEVLVERRPWFRCRFCGEPAPREWGADRRCPKHPKPNRPPYMRSCEFEALP